MGRLSDAEREAARAEYLNDPTLSVTALGERYGVGRTVMLRVLDGITRQRGGQVKAKLSPARMTALADEGLTHHEIAKRAGINESNVSRAIAKYRTQNGSK